MSPVFHQRARESSILLSDAGNHEHLIITRRLSSNAAGQALPISMLIGALDVGKLVPVPVETDNARDEQVVLGAQSGHGILQELRGVHILVDSMA